MICSLPILGFLIPSILLYKVPVIKTMYNQLYNLPNYIYITLFLYCNLINNVSKDYNYNLFYTSLSPIIAFYRLCNLGYNYMTDYYDYNKSSNVIEFDTHYVVKYLLHNRPYFIYVDKKSKKWNNIINVKGIIYSENQDETSSEEETDNDNEVKFVPFKEESEVIEEESEVIQEESEVIQEEVEDVEEEDEDIEEKSNELVTDITSIFDSVYGPYCNFHNFEVTPNLLGYDKVVIYYLNNDSMEEEMKSFEDDEVIHI
jgi:hypothetical protein